MFDKFVPDIYQKSIYTIDYEKLKKSKIKCLIFDLENTIAPNNLKKPNKKLKDLFEELKDMGFKIIIVSNEIKSFSMLSISTSVPLGIFICSLVFADQTSPSDFIWPLPVAQSISSITIPLFPTIEYTLVGTVSFLVILFTKGLVAKISKADEITKTVVWMIILSVKKLISIANNAATPNQNTKNPTVKISRMKNTPDAINHICHIKIPPFMLIKSTTNILYYKMNKI